MQNAFVFFKFKWGISPVVSVGDRGRHLNQFCNLGGDPDMGSQSLVNISLFFLKKKC
jgi:hypothetical protein